MAVAFRSAESNTSGTNSTTVTCSKPPGVVAGDLLVAEIGVTDDRAVTAPAGWTQVQQVSLSSAGRIAVFVRTIDGTEGTTFTFTLASTSAWAIGIAAYSGNNPTVDVSAVTTGAAGTSVTAPSITPTKAPSQLICVVYYDNIGVTFTPPASMTERIDRSHNWGSITLADEPRADTTSTGGRGFGHTDTLGQRWAAASLNVYEANTAPNAPTNLSPSGRTLDRSNTNRFSWDFSDPDSGDSQSQYDLRYRLTSSATWTTVTGTTPNQFRDFPGGTFAAGDYEWQVRTYDAQGVVGPYSSSAFFTAADAPAGPSITDPVAGQTISTETYTVVWSTPSQEAYQVRTVADAAGSPDATIVYTDTGEVTSATARSRSVSFAVNNRAEHVQVRVKNSGLWSSWISVNVTVSYTPPATPTVAVDDTSVSGAIAVRASHPAPSGSQPTVTSVDIYRRVTSEGGDGIRVAKNLAPTALYVDWAVASAVQYSYRVRAYGDNGTSSWSSWSETSTELAVVYGGGYE